MNYLVFEALDGLAHSVLLAFERLLEGAQVALLCAEEVVYLFWKQLDVLHHVPEVFGVDGHVGVVVALEVAVGGHASSGPADWPSPAQVVHDNKIYSPALFDQ